MDSGKGIKLKFCSHQKHNYKEAELLVNVKELGPNAKEGDILEIYHADEDEHQSRLLLQIPHYDEENSFTKDTISVEQNIASSFQLRPYKDVIVNIVDPKSVALELLELTFKDQYLGRSDMWRLKMSLVNTVSYLNKNIEFCSNSIRCQTYEMWAHGEKVSCGVITEDTKIVFRSSTCQAYLFIQMSSEMWEFDMYGDLYFEKAVNGFLAELFTKWKKEGTNHDVTIVLFSRTYYKASSIEEFPPFMRECLMEDYQGGFYEDFYRVAVQSERYDDWMPTLSHLRQLFHNYLDDVLKYHSRPDYCIPEAYNSNAPQGNFLEVLNISLNVFEKHFLDRSFERTGQMSVVITPGVGVFEVDRELTNITKQRIIDNGVGSDLVCLGVQPLHAVPLLKFHKKRGSLRADDYSMPHTWINLSFYSSKKRALGSSTFVPRIKVPQEILKVVDNGKGKLSYPFFNSNMKSGSEEDTLSNSVYVYDEFDTQVFKIPTSQNNRTYRSLQRTPARKKTTSQSSSQPPPRVNFQRILSDSDLFKSSELMTPSLSTNNKEKESSLLAKSPAINIPSKITDNKVFSHSFGALNIEGMIERKLSVHSELEDMSPSFSNKIGSSGTSSPNEHYHSNVGKVSANPRRSLINPFDPSHVTIKLTSSRRRWIHTFPKGPTGVLIQQHHYQMSSVKLSEEEDFGELFENEEKLLRVNSKSAEHQSHDSLNFDEPLTNGHSHPIVRGRGLSTYEGWPTSVTSVSSSIASTKCTSSPQKHSPYPQGVQPPPMPGVGHSALAQINKHATLLWGATGEQEWNAAITTGVDWKSLTLPACLPLTTDYFPDKQSLDSDYVISAYYSRSPDSLDNSFKEMVSQRLSQGFQLIIMRPDEVESSTHQHNSLVRASRSKTEEAVREYKLSIGRVFHWLKVEDCSVVVTTYRPRHPYPPLERRYKFRFRSPYLSQYEVSSGEFKTERLENYKWNDLDNYICSKGDLRECNQLRECSLAEEFKYWRFRLMIIPDVFKAETKKLIDSPPGTRCDIYHSISLEEQHNIVENLIRFLEVIHRIKRQGNSKKSWGARERLGSMRMERPRPRTSGKCPDRTRYEGGNKDKDESGRSHNNNVEEEFKEEGEDRKLNQGMSLNAVVEAMKDSLHGVPMITASHSTLPSFTFISYDATVWVVKRFEDISSQAEAVTYLQKMVDNEKIRHVTDDCTKPFQNGFLIYYIPSEQESNPVNVSSFEVEWHEVSVDPLPNKRRSSNTDFSPSLSDAMVSSPGPGASPEKCSGNNGAEKEGKEMYKLGYLEIDWNNKSDRCEWGHLSYQTHYHPLRCFELIVKWMCATGTIVNDLILTWQRKATNQFLHLFPVPMEPFILPFTFNSNPLRSPIVIPLSIDDVRDPSTPPLEFSCGLREHIIVRFQELILEKFGFMCYITSIDGESKKSYVHVTGNMIVLISQMSESRTKSEKNRRMSMMTPKVESTKLLPCFLWSFNYMLSRRWKSSTSGDEALGEMIFCDFKEFCSNRNQRLKEFWDSVASLLV